MLVEWELFHVVAFASTYNGALVMRSSKAVRASKVASATLLCLSHIDNVMNSDVS